MIEPATQIRDASTSRGSHLYLHLLAFLLHLDSHVSDKPRVCRGDPRHRYLDRSQYGYREYMVSKIVAQRQSAWNSVISTLIRNLIALLIY